MWGNGDWPSLQAQPFIKILLAPVLSPKLAQPKIASDLLDYPLIHQRDRQAWQQWFSHANIDPESAALGTVIDDTNLVLQTALNGQGVALGIFPFIEADIREKRLIRPFDFCIEPENAYHLVFRKSSLKKAAIKQVFDWLCEQVREE